MRLRPSRSDRGGFTLLEITLTLFVIVVGVTALFSLFPIMLKGNRQAVERSASAAFAGSKAQEFATDRRLAPPGGWVVCPPAPKPGPWPVPGETGATWTAYETRNQTGRSDLSRDDYQTLVIEVSHGDRIYRFETWKLNDQAQAHGYTLSR